MSSPLGDRVKILEEDSGLHFLIRLQTHLDDGEIIERAFEKGINISCLSRYSKRQDESQKSMFIVNYSGIDLSRLDMAVEILAEIIRD
jgi:GntR family transcriptional regulator/MocR family aminotransferase